HFVGDMHQPLHAITNADNGGNCVPVKYFRHQPLLNALRPEREDYSPNLHQIWDTEMVERDMEISSPLRYADELDEKFHAQSAAQAAETSLAEAGVRLAMILNEAAKATEIVPLKAGQRVIPP